MDMRARAGATRILFSEQLRSAEREIGAIHAELRAVWQEYLACGDGERRVRLLMMFTRGNEESNAALRAYRMALDGWRDEYRDVHTDTLRYLAGDADGSEAIVRRSVG